MAIAVALDAVRHEMRDAVRVAAEPVQPGDSVKGQIMRAAQRLGVEFSKARKLWYGLPVIIHAHEADRIRAARRAVLIERQNRLEQELNNLQQELSAWDSSVMPLLPSGWREDGKL